MWITNKEGIEYDTEWIKDRCATCEGKFFESHVEAIKRYEQYGNFCLSCRSNLKSRKYISERKLKQWQNA